MTDRDSKYKVLAYFFFFGLMLLADVVLIIVYLAIDPSYNPFPDFTLRVLLSIISVPIVGITILVVQRIKTKRLEKSLQTKYDDLLVTPSTQTSIKKTTKIVLEPVVFQGTKEKQICQLCNKRIKEGQIILHCPACSTIFHYEHFLSWLEKNPLCPVCNTDI
ncbi:MAG: RING finger protein [Candidatus Heimdallarchaeota archaeon]